MFTLSIFTEKNDSVYVEGDAYNISKLAQMLNSGFQVHQSVTVEIGYKGKFTKLQLSTAFNFGKVIEAVVIGMEKDNRNS